MKKSKLTPNLPKNFDESFWEKYDEEIGLSRSSSIFDLKYIMAGLVACSLGVILFVSINTQMAPGEIEMASVSEVLEEYETLIALEENMELFDLTDKEWNEILEGEES